MNSLQYNCWVQLGLVLLTGSLTSSVEAANLGAYPGTSSISTLDIIQTFTEPYSAVGSEKLTVAQLLPDDSLGSESSVIKLNEVIQNEPVTLIEGGASRGANLFHSFEEFNIDTGQQVYFVDPGGIENILSRVTGNNISTIDGLLGVDGAANVFLLNPNGIIFGLNAELDIRGSFLASTGNGFKFIDGGEFSTVNPELPPSLTVNITPGVQFGANPGIIKNHGNLSVGRELTLIGGDVSNMGELTTELDKLSIESVTGNVVLSGRLQSGQDTDIQALEVIEMIEGNISTGGELLIQSDEAIKFSDSQLLSASDMTFRSPIRQLSDGTTFTTGGYFITEDLDRNIVDFLIPHDRVIIAEKNVQLEAQVTGPSLYILAGGSVTSAPDVTGFFVTREGSGTITKTIVDGIGGTQLITVNSNPQPTLDIRSGIDWAQLPGVFLDDINDSNIPITEPRANNANIQVRDIRVIPDSFVLLTNQDHPNSLPGEIILTSINAVRGNITVTSRNALEINNQINTSARIGNGGNIQLIANDGISLLRDSFLSSSGEISGNISLDSGGTIVMTDSFIFSSSNTSDLGVRGGHIQLEAESLDMQGLSALLTRTNGGADAGSISVIMGDEITLDATANQSDSVTGIRSESLRGTSGATDGNTGRIEIQTKHLTVNNGAQIFSITTGGNGISGDVVISVEESANFSGTANFSGINSNDFPSGIFSEMTASEISAIGGDVILSANSVFITEGAQLAAVARESGQAGNVIIDASKIVVSDSQGTSRSQINSVASEVGKAGGNIEINAESLLVENGALIVAVTSNPSQGGNIIIDAGNILLDGTTVLEPNGQVRASAIATSSFFSSGDAGDITVNAENFTATGGAIVATSTFGTGEGGELKITATDTVRFSGIALENFSPSGLSADAFGEGRGGSITINSSRLILEEGASISASSFGSGQAGDITIDVPLLIDLSGNASNGYRSGFYVQAFSSGNSGNLTVLTEELSIRNGANITTASGNVADAGIVPFRIGANEVVDIELPSNPTGNAGDIEMYSTNTTLTNNSKISSETTTVGDAGTINFIPYENNPDLILTFQGEAQVSASTDGNKPGGNLILNAPESIRIQGEGQLITESRGVDSGPAGNIIVTSPFVTLDNGVEVAAQSESFEGGGNINFDVSDVLLLRQGSFINTESTNAISGRGGNVNIEAGFVIAVPNENSDIIANAIGGDGGSVDITTNRLLGFIEQRDIATTAELRNNISSDLSASSQFGRQGEIIINNLALDPTQGLVELPTLSSNPSLQRGCSIDVEGESSFTVSGRGGLPPSPTNILRRDQLLTDLGPETLDILTNASVTEPSINSSESINEAQGLVKTPNGRTFFVSEVSNSLPQYSLPQSVQCSGNGTPEGTITD